MADTHNPQYSFDPVTLGTVDLEFLLEHVGKPTIVALRNAGPNVLPAAVRPILDRVNELQELEKHEGLKWVGIEAIKNAIHIWFRENKKWKNDHTRNPKAPRWPSLYSYDAKGRPHWGGPGSDSGRVRTWFGPAGERIPFAINYIVDDAPEWKAPGFTETPADKFIKIDTESHRIECRVPVRDGICGHSESYKGESRTSYAAARARMSKHLRKATENIDQHRETYTNEFGS